MSPEGFAERVIRLEAEMSELRELSAQVHGLTVQVSQLHSEMGAEFSAVRREMRELHEDLLGRLDAVVDDNRRRLDAVIDDNRAEMRALREDFLRRLDTDVLGRLDADKNDTRREMRVLHEEVLSRIALLGEGKAGRPHKKTRRPKQ